MGEQRIVYSVITGGYDVPLPARHQEPGLRYILFTDARPRRSAGWDIRPLPPEAQGLGPVLANRWAKFFAHRLFPEARLSLYLDGNLRILGPLAPLFDAFEASGAAIGLSRHPQRHDVEEEVEACIRLRKFTPDDLARLDPQLARYRASGLNFAGELTENGAILRDHRHEGLAPAMDLWWQELTSGVRRDQISLPWVRLSAGLPTWFWPNYRIPNPYFLGPFTHKPRMGWYQSLTYVARTQRSDSRLHEARFIALRLPGRLAEALGVAPRPKPHVIPGLAADQHRSP
jgi:Protein of unknown function (DUF616)